MFAVCLGVLAAFAVASVASAVAAEPALYECGKASKEEAKYESKGKQKTKNVYTGLYTEKKCLTLAAAGKYRAEGKPEGKYELKEGIGKGKAFKGKSTGGSNLEVVGVGGVGCTSASDTGKFNTPTSGDDIVATFKGCEFNGKQCQSGSAAGEIVTNNLIGGVGYLEGKGTPTPKVGSDISAETGEVLAEFTCGESEGFAATGSVIAQVAPVNKFTKEATFVFKQKGIGVQEWESFEGGLTDTLTTHICQTKGCNPITEGFTAASAEEATFTNKGEELEVKA